VTKRNTRAEALVYLAAQKGAAILHLEECGGEAAAEDLAEAIAEAFPQHIGFGSFAIEPDDIVEMLRQEGFVRIEGDRVVLTPPDIEPAE